MNLSIMDIGMWPTLLAVIVIASLTAYYYLLKKLNYWKDRGVEGHGPWQSITSLIDLFLVTTSIHESITKNYNKWKQYKFFGTDVLLRPTLVITDLDLIKNILIKDFHIFYGRGNRVNENIDPLGAHLFNLDGDRWKILRTKLTPVFTSGKLKHMFELMLECADHYEDYIKKEVEAGNVIEFREASAKFTTDVIGSCAFGLEMNAISNDDSEFRRVGRKVFEFSRFTFMKRLLGILMPKLVNALKLHLIDPEINDFFISSVKQTINYRERENVVRHDLVNTLIEIQKTQNKELKVTDELLAAQAFIFFLAGFETSSTTISFALYELAYNPDVQEKLIKEIHETLERNNGKITYAVSNEMKYLEMVIDETLRKNPPVPVLQRQSFEPYTIPGTDITIDAGTRVLLPIYCIQRDPEYYPDPERFDPERFSEEAKQHRHPMAHLPFGDGPKNCIGSRFAAYQVKLGLIKIFKNYRVKPTPLSPYPYTLDPASVITRPIGGVHLKLEPITNKKFD